jgi:uncharacterized surface protein with fasciclin (FAS1) repeats
MGIDIAHRARRARFLALGVIAGTFALAAAGCGSSGNSAATGASASHHPMAGHSHAMAETATFGSDCGMIPHSGMGSLHSMSMDTLTAAAFHNPLLTSFAADVKSAGLASELDSMHAFTVFAPANAAFHKLSGHEMSMMMHSPGELAKVLKYHVVDGRITPSELAHGMTLRTLAGSTLKGGRMGGTYEVNGADVICGNIRTENATIYVINKVLTPMR